jgi:phage shock protein PspC (stress-responsive transcriptional regulator)
MNKRLYKSRDNKVIDGVCGGLGEYFGIDPIIIRLLWVVAIFVGGTGVLAYIIAMIIIPEAPRNGEPIEEGEEGTAYSDAHAPASQRDSSKLLGLGMIALGFFFFARRFFPWFDMDLLWPFALVAVGAVLILKRD